MRLTLKHLTLVSSNAAVVANEAGAAFQSKALTLASNADPDAKRAEARAALMAHPLGFEDFSVGSALTEANRLDRLTDHRSISRSAELCDALEAVGFTVIAADPQLGLSAQMYIYVHDPKKVVKNLPGLKPHLHYLEQGATFG